MPSLRCCCVPPLRRCGRRGDELFSLRFYSAKNRDSAGFRCASKSIVRIAVWYTFIAMGIIMAIFTYIKGIQPMQLAKENFKKTTCTITQEFEVDGPGSNVYGNDLYRIRSDMAYHIHNGKQITATLFDRPYGDKVYCNKYAAKDHIPKIYDKYRGFPQNLTCYYDPSNLKDITIDVEIFMGNASCIVTPQAGMIAAGVFVSMGILLCLFVSSGSPLHLVFGGTEQLDDDDLSYTSSDEHTHTETTALLHDGKPMVHPPTSSNPANIQHLNGGSEVALISVGASNGTSGSGISTFGYSPPVASEELPDRYELDAQYTLGSLKSFTKLWKTTHQTLLCCCIWPLFAWATLMLVVLYVAQGIYQFELGYNDDPDISLHDKNGY